MEHVKGLISIIKPEKKRETQEPVHEAKELDIAHTHDPHPCQIVFRFSAFTVCFFFIIITIKFDEFRSRILFLGSRMVEIKMMKVPVTTTDEFFLLLLKH